MSSKHVLSSILIGATLSLPPSRLLALESSALLPLCDTPPSVASECADGARNESSWNSGVAAGRSAAQRIWQSAAVNQDPKNWDLFVDEVTETIPRVVASFYQAGFSQFVQCRLQGYLDGTLYAMRLLRPEPACIWCGFDWGRLAKGVYCHLSIRFGGLANRLPWFLHRPEGVCEDGFRASCETAHLASGGEACLIYTQGAFARIYADSVLWDCD